MKPYRDIPTEPIGPSLTLISCGAAFLAALAVALFALLT